MVKKRVLAMALVSLGGIVGAWLFFRPLSGPQTGGINGGRSKQPASAVAPSAGLDVSGHVGLAPGSKKKQTESKRSDFSQQWDVIQNEPDYKERPGMLFDLMQEASLQEVHALLKASDDDVKYSVGFRDDMKAAAFERWYRLDPAAAIRAMDASTLTASQKNSRIEVLLEDWASRSPQEVVAFLEPGQLTGVASDLTYGALVRGSASNGDLKMVDTALAGIVDPKLRFYALKSAARVLQRDHADQFDAWLPALALEDRNTALAEAAWMLADKEIERALDRLNELKKLGADELPVTRSRVVVKWTRNDPVKAGQWVLNQELSGEERESLFSLFFRSWVAKDRDAAVAWVEASIERGKIDEAFMNRVATRL